MFDFVVNLIKERTLRKDWRGGAGWGTGAHATQPVGSVGEWRCKVPFNEDEGQTGDENSFNQRAYHCVAKSEQDAAVDVVGVVNDGEGAGSLIVGVKRDGVYIQGNVIGDEGIVGSGILFLGASGSIGT